jgi:hypothetical protein
LVDPLEVADELRGHSASGLAGDVAWSDSCQQRFGLGGREVLLRTARDQLQQELVDLRHLAGVLVPERATTVDQQPQHGELFVVDHRSQPAHPGADQGDRVRVGGIGLATLPGGEYPCAR